MRYWVDQATGMKLCEPDCADEWLFQIWATGCDYDGCATVEELKQLIDELVAMSQKARSCLHEGKIFSADGNDDVAELLAYLNGVKEVKVWDRVPAISDSDLDKMFETVMAQ